MTHEELEERIEKMEMSTLKQMSYTNMCKLTDGFSEDLVKKIITKSKSQVGQRELINIIMGKYDEWKKETDPTWVIGLPGRRKIFPKYIEDMYFNIDCGEIIEDECPKMIGTWGGFPIDNTDLDLAHDVIEDKLIQNEDQMTQDIYNQLDSRIAELEEENASLKHQLPTANTTTSDNGRQIDIEQLKTHFKAPFKKEGGGFETLLTMLMQGNNPKFFAMIASEIYNSKYFFKGDFQTFAIWYKEFCKLAQCKCVPSYKQSKLKPSPKQSAAFGFLHI